MATFRQTFLKPGKYRQRGQLFQYGASDLRLFVDGTNAAIKDGGMDCPLFDRHAPPGADDKFYAAIAAGDPSVDPNKLSALQTCGRICRLEANDDGSIAAVFDVTDKEAERKILDKSIRFTSPELRDVYHAGDQKDWPHVIRHLALTPVPRSSDQGEFIQDLDEQPVRQFSLDDFEVDDMAKTAKQFALHGGAEPNPVLDPKGEESGDQRVDQDPKEAPGENLPVQAEVATTNTDPKEADDGGRETQEMQELSRDISDSDDLGSMAQALIEKLGLFVPGGGNINSGNAEGLVLLLTALANKLNAGDPSTVSPNAQEVNTMGTGLSKHTPVQEETAMLQFDEKDVAGLPEKARDAIKHLVASNISMAKSNAVMASQVKQFAEDRTTALQGAFKTDQLARIAKSGVCKPLADVLTKRLETVQFAEDDAVPLLHPADVAELVAEHYKGAPKLAQFDGFMGENAPAGITEHEPPDEATGGGEISQGDADKLARSQLERFGYVQPHDADFKKAASNF